MIAEDEQESQGHKDHCIEILRQRLMCTPDLNIYTYHWVRELDLPFGNLYTQHRCIDWDHFHNWTQKHIVNIEPGKKPHGIELWE